MHDRRQIKRWKISWQAKLKLEGALAFIDCSIIDLSFKGFQVALAPKLPTDAFIKLSLILADGCVVNDIEVWVAWHRKVQNLNLYGFYFSRIKDEDKEKIYKFMRGHFSELLHNQWWQETTKGGEEMEDRRIFERLKVRLPLKLFNLSENREAQAVTEDISAKGVGCITEQELKPGTPLEMWLELPDKGEPVYIRGAVAWSQPRDTNNYRLGINLEKAHFMQLAGVLKAA